MKKLRIGTFVLLTLAIVFPVSLVSGQQQFSANKGFEWLVGRGQDGNYGNDVTNTALAVMALKEAGQTEYANAGIRYIQSQEDTSKRCWPKSSCTTKDTAFALWVLDSYGEDTSDGEVWLRQAMTSALRDNWFLEVVTTNNGTCKISYTKAGSTTQTQKDVPVNQGRFTSCRGNFPNTFLEMNTCLESGLLNSNPGLTLDVNCNELGPSTIISVVYNSGNKYYLLKEAATARDIITVQNGCFGTSSRSSCNSDSSLFVNWIMHELDSDVSVLLWLKNNYDSLKVTDNALLYLATKSEEYLRQLKRLQRNDGSFNNQVFDTAIAVLALSEGQSTSEKESAINWLKSKQSGDGSWENNLYKTALVLYSSFATASVSIPGGPIGPVEPFCGDGTCGPDENSDICPDDCPSERGEICDKNGICDTVFGENSGNCPEDCSCGDRICDSTEDEVRCPEDCKFTGGEQVCGNDVVEAPEECDGSDDGACPGECISPGEENECMCEVAEEGKFPWWLLIVIAAFVIIAVIFYLRIRSKKPTRPPSSGSKPDLSFLTKPPLMPPPQKPSYKMPASNVRSKVEDELEKSISEAKKLFKKL